MVLVATGVSPHQSSSVKMPSRRRPSPVEADIKHLRMAADESAAAREDIQKTRAEAWRLIDLARQTAPGFTSRRGPLNAQES